MLSNHTLPVSARHNQRTLLLAETACNFAPVLYSKAGCMGAPALKCSQLMYIPKHNNLTFVSVAGMNITQR